MTTTHDRAQAAAANAVKYAGTPPEGIHARTWHRMVQNAADAIAGAQSVENDGTPEEYAVAALRAAVHTVRLAALAEAQSAIMREARRGPAGAPSGQHLTYGGGLRRAAKVLDPLLGAAMVAEDAEVAR